MDNRKKASVIVPIYNVAAYLNQCVASLVRQSYPNLEIILVDDGATDDSGAIAEQWGKKDARVRVFHRQNEGLSVARNIGIQAATGEYLLFVDSDDYVAESYVENLVDALESEDADISMCKYYTVWADEITLEQKLPAEKRSISTEEYLKLFYTYSGHYSVVWNKAYRKKLFEHVSFEEGKRNEDARIMLFIMLEANKVAHTPDGLYYYRQRQSSIMNGVSKDKVLRSELDWIAEHLTVLKENGKDTLYTLALKLYFNKMAEFYVYLEGTYKKEIKQALKQTCRQLTGCVGLSFKSKLKILFCSSLPEVYGKLFCNHHGKDKRAYYA